MIDEERAAIRRRLGSCPCGLAPGAEHCPICDGILGYFGRHLREQGKTLAEIVDAERAVIAVAHDQSLAFGDDVLPRDLADTLFRIASQVASQGTIDAGKVLAALDKPKLIPLHAPRPMNRHERRKAAIRRCL